LFMVSADVVEPRCPDRIVEVHGTPAGDKKNMPCAPIAKLS
jgi:hypothetical protein